MEGAILSGGRGPGGSSKLSPRCGCSDDVIERFRTVNSVLVECSGQFTTRIESLRGKVHTDT